MKNLLHAFPYLLLMLFISFLTASLQAQSCVAPTTQASQLVLTPKTTAVSGTFTVASDADTYLIIRSSSNSLSAVPANNTNYISGNSLGGGTVVASQSAKSFTDNTALNPSTIYYYFIFSANKTTCTGGPIYNTDSPLIGSTTIPNGSTTYATSGTWICPVGVSSIQVACYGAGGGGGAGGNSWKKGGGGGGGGAYANNAAVAVTTGNSYTITVGAGGIGGSGTNDGTNGGASSFQSIVIANGGFGGESNDNGGDGGNGATGGTYNGGKGANGGTTTSGGGGGGGGSSANGSNAVGINGGAGGTGGGGLGGNGSDVGTTAGVTGGVFGAGGGGATGSTTGGNGGAGCVRIIAPCNSFTPTFTSEANATTCAGHPVTYTTQSGQLNYIWTVSGIENSDYQIISGGTEPSNYTVTINWLTTGSKTVAVNYSAGTCLGDSAASSSTTVTSSPSDATFTVATPTAIELNESVTYTTHNGMANYRWTLTGTEGVDYTITSGGIGASDNTATVSWHTSGVKTATVNYTNTGGCYAPTEASSSTSVALPIPTFTTTPAAEICTGTTATYTTQSAQNNYSWSVSGVLGTDYTINTGGLSSTDHTVTVTWLTVGSKTVSVNYENSEGNEGAFPASSTIAVITIPSITAVINGSCCGGGWKTVDLAAEANYGGMIDWYDVSTGGTSLSSGNTYSPSINADKYFYVDASNTCGRTSTRSAVFGDKNPPAPTLLGSTVSGICVAGTASLSAAYDNYDVIRWYDIPSGGTSLITGANFTTDYLTTTTTYYVEAENCDGISVRTPITATVSETATLNSTYSPDAICSGAVFAYTATSSTPGVSFSWERPVISGISNGYGSGSSETINETLTSTSSLPIVVTYTIYLTATGCSNTEYITVTVNPAPSITTLFTPEVCSGNSFIISPENGTDGIIPDGTVYSWSAPSVTGGITGGASGSASSTISGTLTNPTISDQTATYTVTPTTVTCTGSVFSVNASVYAIPSVSVVDGNTFPGGTVTFDAICNMGSCTFEWFETETGTTIISTNQIFTTNPLTVTTDFYVEASYNGCTSNREIATANIISCDTLSVWTGAEDNDWNNPNNWSNGTPCLATNLTIPDISTPGVNYPIITSAVTCNHIVFEPGGAVLGLENLTYNKAFIRTKLQRETWYTLTPPLKNMYAGDYAFTGSPVTQMRLFDAINPDSISTGGVLRTGTWTRGFSSPDVALNPVSGFTYFVYEKTYNFPNPISYEPSDLETTFPRLNADSSLVTEYFPFSTYSGRPLSPAWTVSKDPILAYRFAAENASNQLVDISYPLNPGINLIGNPLMTHLDFNELYNNIDNMGVISNKVKFWNGTTFTTYVAGMDLAMAVSSSDNTDNIIPPMQAFFVESPTGGTLHFDLDNDFVANNTMNLRGTSVNPCVLRIESDNGVYKSSTALARRENAKNYFDKADAFKLFTQVKNVPEVYTLEGDVALDINQFEEFPYTVPLCIKSDALGTVSLKFSGVETFGDEVTLELINAKTGEVVDLREENNYRYQIDAEKDEGSLFLSFRKASVITDNKMIGLDHNIQIFDADNQKIRVVSAPNDPIKQVIVFNINGRIVHDYCVEKTSTVDIPVAQSKNIYLVQVLTENNTRIGKVLVK